MMALNEFRFERKKQYLNFFLDKNVYKFCKRDGIKEICFEDWTQMS